MSLPPDNSICRLQLPSLSSRHRHGFSWSVRNLLVCAVLVVLVGLPLQPASAIDYQWFAPGGNPSTGFYETATNWSPNGVPGATDNAQTNAVLPPVGTYYITLSSNRSINTLNVNNANSVFVHGSPNSDGSNSVNVSYTASTAINLTNGTYWLVRGTISGDADGASITGGGNRLLLGTSDDNRINNMTIAAGTLNFTTAGARVALTGTSTLANTTSLTLNNNNRIGFQQTTTLANTLTFNLSGSSIFSVEGTNTLTLGSNVTINASGDSRIGSGLFVAGTGTVVNQGTINKTTTGVLTINPTGGFGNAGSLNITGGRVSVANGITFNSTAALRLNLNSTTIGTGFSPLTVTSGGINLGDATLSLGTNTGINNNLVGFDLDPTAEIKLFIINNTTTNPIIGSFNGLPENTSITLTGTNSVSRTFYIGYNADFVSGALIGGNDVVLSTTPIPEPLHVLGLAAAGLGAMNWFRRRKSLPAVPVA